MSKLVGIMNNLEGRKIYDDDPNLFKWEGDAAYVPVWDLDIIAKTHCDYCGRKVSEDECKGCGAPIK